MAFMEGMLGVVMFVYLAGTPTMCKDSGEVSGEVSLQLPSCSRKEVGEFVLPGIVAECFAFCALSE